MPSGDNTETLVITPACGANDEDVSVTGMPGGPLLVHVDERGAGATAYDARIAPPRLGIELGAPGCRLGICVVRTFGPGAECGLPDL